MSGSREAILSAVRGGRGSARPIPAFVHPVMPNDLGDLFARKARAAVADVHEIPTMDDLPEAIWALIPEETPARLHIPEFSPLRALAWHRAPGLSLSANPPSGDDSALSIADFAIAETGTLAFFSGPASFSSWHFRPGREFVFLRRACILPRLEDVTALVAASRSMPATLNLVTGPSRTADIEQTIELGAHGPRALNILISD